MLKYFARKIFGTKNERLIKSLNPLVDAINLLENDLSFLSDDDLKLKTDYFKNRIKDGATLDDILVEAFALVREASKRTIGLRHFDVQMMGGIMLHRGNIAEMRTGEGKTLVATLPVYLNSLTGEGVHVVTVNDYLAKRDSEWMGPVFKFLGLSVGVVEHDTHQSQKKAAYNCDVTYITNNELGFDYLRDNMVTRKEDRVLRKLNYAIIDEVDSILVDEARTPLIISGATDQSTDKYYTINKIIPMLKGRFVTDDEEIAAKHQKIDLSIGYDFLMNEKSQTVSLTVEGVSKCERILGIDNLYNDVESEWVHHIIQALRAYNFFKKDVDYVSKNNEIIIVDEFTGRLMPGRRWSDGLHQAIEAKENVQIAQENQTLASITFQNYFRMYNKLSGMTGTAITEADEFFEIYKLDVVEIPTNKDVLRKDFADVIYKTQKEKFNAIVEDIIENRKKGRPILVGTKSIEKSEQLSAILKTRGVPHQVLNAKFHEMEANIISQAGSRGTVTIATNMAGRGTDIVLGGNPCSKEDADFVKDAGGLYIIGTERHDSRRIDNQLRGRAGRQGDPGESKFYISLEDDLMRLFGSDKITSLMNFGLADGEEIQHPWISKAIEVAQKRVESMNFDVRKQLLEFDNVMNKQREVVYKQRDLLLFSEDLSSEVSSILEDTVDVVFDQFIPQKGYQEAWDIDGLLNWLNQNINDFSILDLEYAREYPRHGFKDHLKELLGNFYNNKYKAIRKDVLLDAQKLIMMQVVDNCWKENLYNLDQLKKGIGLRAYGQKDPIMEYKQESFNMFINMINRIKQETFEYLFKADIASHAIKDNSDNSDYSLVEGLLFGNDINGAVNINAQNLKNSRLLDKVGRNDSCPCGSGRKYKKCCGN